MSMPRRSVTELRPRGSGGLSYSPDRDLAYLYPRAMREAVWGLDAANWRPWLQQLAERTGLTEELLGEGVKKFTEAHALFVGTPAIQEPTDALRDVGFLDLPEGVKIAIYASLGETMMGGFFVAVRDVTVQGELPPNFVDIALFIGAGRMLRNKLAATTTPELLYGLMAERMEAAIVEREQSRRVIEKLRTEAATLREENAKLLRRKSTWLTWRDWLASLINRRSPRSIKNSNSSGT